MSRRHGCTADHHGMIPADQDSGRRRILRALTIGFAILVGGLGGLALYLLGEAP